MKTGIELIAEERTRQIEVEKWDYNHDEDYQSGELIGAAGCYVANALNKQHGENTFRFERKEVSKFMGEPVVESFIDAWPWSDDWDKRAKHDKKRSLVIAGALLAAELDRLNSTEE